MILSQIKAVSQQTFTSIQHFTWQRNVIMGAGLSYAWGQDKYLHIPLILVTPGLYAGYHMFTGCELVREFFVKCVSSDKIPTRTDTKVDPT